MKTMISFLLLFCVLISCTKDPLTVDLPTVVWVDSATSRDTIITRYSYDLNTVDANIYYAVQNWQMDATGAKLNGSRMIAIYAGDSIYLSKAGAGAGDYDGPYLFKFTDNGQKLHSQDFLNPPSFSQGRTYLRLN